MAQDGEKMKREPPEKEILIVFSDLDGTLIHYPRSSDDENLNEDDLKLPPSSTGMRGVISAKTLALCQEIRRQGIPLVLVSGMRTSTLMNRLPFLPRADAYCSETGGRIFYPVPETQTDDDKDDTTPLIVPQNYRGASDDALQPFRLVEDMEWRRRMEQITGPFDSLPSDQPSPAKRDGLLWEFSRHLVDKGFNLDTKGYAACFRVNRKQQSETITDDDFRALSDGTIVPWKGLATSINLSCVDFYPSESGKKNCCKYLAEKFFPDHRHTFTNMEKSDDIFLANHAVCLCDDDNDMEMALACHHAYLPDVASKSMEQVVRSHPDHFTQTGGVGANYHGPLASEAALSMIVQRIATSQTNKTAFISTASDQLSP